MGLFEVIGGAVGLYTVVPVSEAHIRVMNNKKEVFMSRSMSKTGPKWKEDMKRATPNVSPVAKFLAGQFIKDKELELNRLVSLVKVMP